MKSAAILLASSLAFVVSVPIRAGAPDEPVAQKAAAIEQQVIAWRRDIHEHPELGNREFRTAKIVADHLRSLGIEVKTEVAKTGVTGLLEGGKPGPVVALRADLDALPVTERARVPFASKVRAEYNGQEVGVSHACGHDAHVAILMGVAQILAGMREQLPGSVKFIFQPAEEGAPVGERGGAEWMVEEGVLDHPKVDAIFGLHVSSEDEVGLIEYRPGGTMASVNDFQIVIHGKSSHGAAPWNSVDPIVTAAQLINHLQTIVSRNVELTENAAVVTVGSIHGGNRSNIIPESVELMGTLRAFTEADEQRLIQRLKQIAVNTAEAAGARIDIKVPYSVHYPVTYNDPALTERMLPSLRKAVGAQNVRLRSAITGAEDFSFFQQKVPGLYFFLGAMKKGADRTAAQHHTPDFYIDEAAFAGGVQALTHLTLDYLTSGKSK